MQYLFQAPAVERQAVADAIAASSPVSWQHVNLHGEYDFSDQPLPAEAPFDLDLITAWQPPAKPGQG